MTADTVEGLAQALERLREQVQYLSDCEAIRQTMYGYARGVDRLDEHRIAAAYHPDGWDDHGAWRADGTGAPRTLMARGLAGSATASTHQLGNMLIDIRGDVADTETYFIAYQRVEQDGRLFTRTRAGRYLDRWERRDGCWRVFRRQVVDDWSRVDEVVATAAEVGEDSSHGTRDRADPSYAFEQFVADPRRGKSAQ